MLRLFFRSLCWFGVHYWSYRKFPRANGTQGRACLRCGKIEAE